MWPALLCHKLATLLEPCCHVRLAGCDLRNPKFIVHSISAWNQTVVSFLPEVGYTLCGRQLCGVRILYDNCRLSPPGHVGGRLSDHIQTTMTQHEVTANSCQSCTL